MFTKLKQSLADSVVDVVDKIENVGNRISTSTASSVTGSISSDSHNTPRNDVTKSTFNDSLAQSTNSMDASNYMTPNSTFDQNNLSTMRSTDSPAVLDTTPHRPRTRNDSVVSDFSISNTPSSALQTLRDYALPSDVESECADQVSMRNISNISKEELARKYAMQLQKVDKYRSKFTRVVVVFRELESERNKLKLTLTKCQDKAFRRIAEMKEQHALDQKAKIHIEQNFAAAIDDKADHIRVLQTQVELLKKGQQIPSELMLSNKANQSVEGDTVQSDASKSENISDQEAAQTQLFKDKIKRLEILLTKCKDTIKTNKENQKQLTLDRDDAQRKLAETLSQLNGLQTDYTSTTADLRSRLKVTTDELSVRQLEIASDKQQMHHTLDTSNDDLVSTKSQVASLKMENEMLRNQGEQQLEKSRAVIRNLRADIDRLNSEMNNEIDERIKQVEIEREEEFAELKRGKVEALTLIQKNMGSRSNSTSDDQIDQLTVAHEAALQSLRFDHQGALDSLRFDHQGQLDTLKTDYEGKLDALQKDNEQLLMKTSEVDIKSDLIKKLDNARTEEQIKMDRQKSEYEQKIESIQNKLFSSITELQEKIAQVNSEKERTIEEMNNTQEEEILQLKEKHAKQLNEKGDNALLNMESTHNDEIDNLRKTHDNKIESLQQSNDLKLQSIEEQLSSKNQEFDELQDTLASITSELDNIKTTLDLKSDEIHTLNHTIDAKTSEIEHLNENQNTIQGNVDSLNESVVVKTSEINELKDIMCKREKETNERLTVLDREKSELTMEFDFKIAELLAETKLLEQFKNNDMDKDEITKSLKEENIQLKNSLENTKRDLFQASTLLEDLKKTIETKNSEYDSLKLAQTEKESELYTEIEHLKCSRHKLEMDAKQTQHQQEVDEKQREIDDVKRTSAQQKIDEAAECERLRLADELFERTQELSESRDKFTKAQKELADTEALIATRTGDAAETRRELVALKESESQLATRLDDTKTECETALEKAEQSRLCEVTALTDQLSDNGRQLTGVVEELAESRQAMAFLAESLDREDKRAVQLELELNSIRELYQTKENDLTSTIRELEEKSTLLEESKTTVEKLNSSLLNLKDEISKTQDQLVRQERLTEEIRELGSKDKDEASQALMEQLRCANDETTQALANVEKMKADKQLFMEQSQSTIEGLKREVEILKEKEIEIENKHKTVLQDVLDSLKVEIENRKAEEAEHLQQIEEQKLNIIRLEEENKQEMQVIIDSIKLDCQAEVKVLNDRLDSERENMTTFKENVKKQFDTNHDSTKETIAKLKEGFTASIKDNKEIAERQQQNLIVDTTKGFEKKISLLKREHETEMASQSEQLQSSEKAMQAASSDASRLREENDSLTSQLDESQTRMDDMCSESDSRFRQKEEELIEARRITAEIELRLDDAGRRALEAREDHSMMCAESDRRAADSTAQLAAESDNNKRLTKHIETLTTELENVKSELATIESDLKISTDATDSVTKSSEHKFEQLKIKFSTRVKQKQEKHNSEIEKLNLRLSENNDIIKELSERLDKTSHSLDDTEKQLEITKDNSKKQNHELESLRCELSESREQVETLGDLASNLRHQSEEREADTSLERHRADTQTAETVARLEAVVDEARCSSEALQMSLNDSRIETCKNDELHKNELEDLKKQHLIIVKDLNDKLESVENSITSNKEGTQHKEVKLKTLINSLKREKRDMADKISEFESKELERSEQDENVERRIDEAKLEFNETIEDMQREHESKLKLMLKTYNQEMREKSVDHEKELEIQRDKSQKDESRFIAEHHETLKELNSDINERDDKIDSIEEMYELRIRETEDKMKDIQSEHVAAMNAMNQQIKDFKENSEIEIMEKIDLALQEKSSNTDLEILKQLDNCIDKDEKLPSITEWLKSRVIELTQKQQDTSIKQRICLTNGNGRVSEIGDYDENGVDQDNTTPTSDIKQIKDECRSLQAEIVKQTGEVAKLKISERELKFAISEMNSPATLQLNSETLLGESTEIEYLRNVIFEYMTGRETKTLAKVIMTVLHFSNDQKRKVDQIQQSSAG